MFTDEEIAIINSTTLYDLIIRVTDIGRDDIQSNVFLNLASDPTSPCHFDFQLSEDMLDNCTVMETFDYFTGSEAPYIVTFTSLGLWIIILIVLLAVLTGRRRRQAAVGGGRSVQQEKLSGNWTPIINCTELLTDTGNREVTICVTTDPRHELAVITSAGIKLRIIDLSATGELSLWEASNDSTLLLARVSNGYDLILRFHSLLERDQFIRELQETLGSSVGVDVTNRYDSNHILSNAITRQKRQQLVEDFLREVFTRASQPTHAWQAEGEGKKRVTEQVLNFELSKEEFAATMGMTKNSLFVEQMFGLADTDNSGFVTFRELLDLLVMFNKGSVDDKMRLMFNLYDIDNSGSLDKEEFLQVTRSLLEIVNTSVKPDELDVMAKSMFESRGLGSKDQLTFEDFKALVQNQSSHSPVTSRPHPQSTARAQLLIPGETGTLVVVVSSRVVCCQDIVFSFELYRFSAHTVITTSFRVSVPKTIVQISSRW